jgi:hypothetical protein
VSGEHLATGKLSLPSERDASAWYVLLPTQVAAKNRCHLVEGALRVEKQAGCRVGVS